MHAEGEAAPSRAGDAGEGDGGSLRRRFLAQLVRVDEALRQWDAWEAQARRTPRQGDREGRRGSGRQVSAAPPEDTPRPALTRPALTDLRQLLVEELARLDAEA